MPKKKMGSCCDMLWRRQHVSPMKQRSQATRGHLGAFWWNGKCLMDIFQTKSYDMQWPQLEGWEDKGKDIIDFNLGFSDEVFAVECRKNIQQ